MDRVSLGIILPGNPECVQKEKAWIRTLELIVKIEWILSALITVVLFVTDSLTFGVLMKLVFVTAALLMARYIWSNKVRCPYCKHFRTMKRISDNKTIGTSERGISRKNYDYQSGAIYDLRGNIALYSANVAYREHGVETTKTYTYNRRCSFCGCVDKVKEEYKTKNFG